MAMNTLEQYLGIDDPSQLPTDFPVEGEGGTTDRSGAPQAAGGGGPRVSAAAQNQGGDEDSGALPPTEEGGSEAPPPTVVPPEESTGPGHQARIGIPARNPVGGGWNTVDGQPPPSQQAPTAPTTPTPPSTDYTQLNALLSKLLEQSQAGQSANADYKNNIRSTILSLIKSGSAPVDPNDPTIAGATSAFRGEGERALALLREKQAEASRAGGRTAGSEESAVKGGYEDLGNATGSYKADLMVKELQSRRQQLMQATQLGAGLQSEDEKNALASQIAQIDAQLKTLQLQSSEGLTKTGLTNQNTQFYDNLSYLMGKDTNSLDSLLAQYLTQGG